MVFGYNVHLKQHRDRAGAANNSALRKSLAYLWADAVVHPTQGHSHRARFVALMQSLGHPN